MSNTVFQHGTAAEYMADGGNLETPWGRAQHIEKAGDGIWSVSTARHGGFFLRADKVAEMPADKVAGTWNGQGARGWFEEDVDWSLVALSFPSLFDEMIVTRAAQIAGWAAERRKTRAS